MSALATALEALDHLAAALEAGDADAITFNSRWATGALRRLAAHEVDEARRLQAEVQANQILVAVARGERLEVATVRRWAAAWRGEAGPADVQSGEAFEAACREAAKTDPAPPPVHARGFPDFGPLTMCGEPGPVPEVCGEVTCERCLDIVCDTDALVRRLRELEVQSEDARARWKGRTIRFGGGKLVDWQDDDGQWYRGTVAGHGDRGFEIVVETMKRVDRDLRIFSPDRVREP